MMTLKLSMPYRVLEYYQICSNNDPGLTLTYFTAKGKTMDFFKNSVVYDVKVSRCS